MKPDKVKGGLIRPRRLLSLYYPIGGSAQPRQCVGVLDEGQCGVALAVRLDNKARATWYQLKEAIQRRAAGETLAEIAKSYAVDLSMISRLS